MSISPNSSLVHRTIDLNYANRKRANALKWSLVNGLFLLVFAYDLWWWCPGQNSVLQYVECITVAVLTASLLHHIVWMLPNMTARPAAVTPKISTTPLTLTHAQQRLLGLSDADLDSSFRVIENEPSGNSERSLYASTESAALSLSPRTWRSRSSPSPPPPRVSPQLPDRHAPDHFIADHRTLTDYLKQYEERSRLQNLTRGSDDSWSTQPSHPAPHYQLAALETDGVKAEEGTAQGSPQVWWRLHLDPQRATQWNLNLRLWLHVTILERLVREMDAIDAAFANAGSDVRIGQVSVERLRSTCGAVGTMTASLRALLPFLEPFPDQRYVVQRIQELSNGGCLSAYRWCGGGSEWEDSRPTDAELILHLLATYLDGQVPSGGRARPFSSTHLSSAPASPVHGPRALCIHRVSRRPPHYVLVLGEDTLDAGRGRNNLLHTVLLFIAACAARDPPALCRLHLGRAGLNMLWIIGR